MDGLKWCAIRLRRILAFLPPLQRWLGLRAGQKMFLATQRQLQPRQFPPMPTMDSRTFVMVVDVYDLVIKANTVVAIVEEEVFEVIEVAKVGIVGEADSEVIGTEKVDIAAVVGVDLEASVGVEIARSREAHGEIASVRRSSSFSSFPAYCTRTAPASISSTSDIDVVFTHLRRRLIHGISLTLWLSS